jgi:uncharacterized protein (UPF0332 family)
VLEPGALIILSRRLVRDAAREAETVIRDAYLQRAVSTAYYAVFHMLIQAATDRFIGSGHLHTPTACILYRGFDHRTMRTVCEDLQKPTIKDKYKQLLRRTAVSPSMRQFSVSFPALQDHRHAADYDPQAKLEPSQASEIVDEAVKCMLAFGSADTGEQADILALLLVGARG